MTDPRPRHDPRPLTDDDYRALSQFRHALRVFLRFSEDAARRSGLTPAQHQLLLAIRGWSGVDQPSVSDLAELLQLRHHSASELVSRAEAAGLVTSATDALDGRWRRVALTDRGAQQVAALSLLHRDELRRFRDEMTDVLRELD